MMKNGPALFCTLLLLPLSASAQAPEEKEKEIDALVARLPLLPAAAGRKVTAALVARLPGSATRVCRGLAAAAPGREASWLHALEGMSRLLTGKGREEERNLMARALCRYLEQEKPPAPVAATLLRTLAPLAGPAQVPFLATLLRHPRLADPAARVLAQEGGEQAGKALLAALLADRPVAPVALVHALTRMEYAQAASPLLALAAAEKTPEPIRIAADRALAILAHPAARSHLTRRLADAGEPERGAALANLLRYARRRAGAGDRVTASRICRSLLDRSWARAGVLDTLVRIQDQGALPELVKAMHQGGAGIRRVVTTLSLTLPDPRVTVRWSQELPVAEPGAARAILDLLARRGDDAAWPAVTASLSRPEPEVRGAALRCAYTLRREKAFSHLLAHLERERSTGEIEEVAQAVRQVASAAALARVGRALPRLRPPAAAAMMEALARRRARAQCPAVLAMTTHLDSRCRRAALTALADLGDAGQIPLLLATALGGEPRPERRAAIRAVVALGRRTGHRQAFLTAFQEGSGPARVHLLSLFPRLGGDRLLNTVLEATRTATEGMVRDAAFRALFAWPDPAAAPALLDLARNKEEPKQAILALRALARLADGGKLAPPRALALIRSAYPLARRVQDRTLLLSRCASLHLEETILFLLPLLDEKRNGPDARRAALAAATLDRRRNRCLQGGPVVVAMARILRAGTDDKVKQAARRILLNQREGLGLPSDLRKKGFRPLFNGKDLAGWQGLVGNPLSRAALVPAERARVQAEADRVAREHWQAVGGMLFHDGKGANLCTVKEYGDFELFLDWMIEPGGDSGIYLRGTPQVQIWDAGRWKVGSGGLYNNKRHPSKPLVTADRPPCRWNRFRIRMEGERVTVHLNGRLVVDRVVMENYWDRNRPIFTRGPIELQHHQSPLYFRNLYIREIGK